MTTPIMPISPITPWWKFIYDTRTPTFHGFGKVAFVQGETEAEARAAALVMASKDFPGAEILEHAIGQSTEAAATAYFDKRRRLAQWQENVRTGVANTRDGI